jgi:hypothetical protein
LSRKLFFKITRIFNCLSAIMFQKIKPCLSYKLELFRMKNRVKIILQCNINTNSFFPL